MSWSGNIGSIRSIKMENFMTYSNVYLEPGPLLNIIAAPNGTGKSSIFCGVCLVLGGCPSVLGRAKNIVDYIKHGCNEAKISITIQSKESRNDVVERKISHLKPHSVFMLNGIIVSEKSIKELVEEYGIYVQSLCQFLPQDRVADFTKMTSQQLLVEVETTLNIPHLREYHVELISLHKEIVKIDSQLSICLQEIQAHKHRRDLISKELALFEERKSKNELSVKIDEKIAWLLYEKERVIYYKALEDAKESEAKLEVAEAQLKCFIQKKAQFLKVHKMSSNPSNSESKKAQIYFDELKNRLNEMSSMQRKIDLTASSLDQCVISIEENERSISDVNSQLVILKNSLAEFENIDHSIRENPESSKLEDQISTLTDEYNRIYKELSEISKSESKKICERNALESELRAISVQENKVIKFLKLNEPETYNAVLWLKENQDMFREKIFEPILTQIRIKNPEDGKYLENHVARRDLFAFLCQNSDDMKRFLHEIREKRRWRVSIISISPTYVIPTCENILELKKFPFRMMLKDTFDCPKPVMAFLCQNYKVHNVPIFNQMNETAIEKLINDLNILCFFSGTEKHVSKRSVYTYETLTQVSEIRPGYLCSSSSPDEYKLEELRKAIKLCVDEVTHLSKLKNMQSISVEDIKRQIDSLKHEKTQIKERYGRIHMMKTQQLAKEKRLSSLLAMTKELKDSLESHKESLRSLLFEKLQLLANQKGMYDDCYLKHLRVNFSNMISSHAASQAAEVFERLYQSESQKNQVLRSDLEEKERFVSQTKESTQKLLQTAQEVSKHTRTMPTKEYFDDLEKCCPGLSLTQLRAYKFQLLALNAYDPKEHGTAKDDFNEVFNSIEKKQSNMDSLRSVKASLKSKEEDILSKWIPAIEEIVFTLSQNFSSYFADVGTSGCIEFYKDPLRDYENYGLNIMVQYRKSENLTLLSSIRHSGGERSVATILFLISLQNCFSSPLRFVDEVNQAMDEVNERKVLLILMKSMSSSRKTQCFFITPKLVSNLVYDENATVLIIYNGPMVNCSLSEETFTKTPDKLESKRRLKSSQRSLNNSLFQT